MGRKDTTEKSRVPEWVKALLITLLIIIGILGIVIVLLLHKWQRATYLTADMFQASEAAGISVHKINELDEAPEKTQTKKYQEDVTITYNGKKYRYNDNLINILVMGIDDYGLKGDKDTDANPYQADTIVLGTVDAVKKTVSFMSIPRDTVASIKVLDLNDEVATVKKGPIAIQHSFGTQGERTNEAVVDAVSNLLYSVPINRYVSVDITAIPDINDSLGGITVDIPEDLTKWNPKMKAGTKDYLLLNKDAVIFVARRDTGIDDSAMGRMKRQVMYLKKLFTYLAKLLLDLELSDKDIVSVPGEMKRIEPGEIEDYEYEMGYIVDEDALKQLIVDRFYTPAE